MTDVLRINRSQIDELIAHARRCSPEEACGILAGTARDGERLVRRVFLMENAEHSSTFYVMDSRDQFRVFDQMEKDGLEAVCIFHSHPHSPAWPSATDLELAFYPDSLYMIVSLAGSEPESRVFRIVDGKITETRMEIDERAV
jgi:proteasome lid subunit RPN8/RPN11